MPVHEFCPQEHSKRYINFSLGISVIVCIYISYVRMAKIFLNVFKNAQIALHYQEPSCMMALAAYILVMLITSHTQNKRTIKTNLYKLKSMDGNYDVLKRFR